MSAACPSPAEALASLDDATAAAVAHALAHPVRIRILRLLGSRPGCYCGDLCDEFPLAQSTISQHLKVLRQAGLVQGTRSGTAVCYCVDPARLEAFLGWSGRLLAAAATSPDAA